MEFPLVLAGAEGEEGLSLSWGGGHRPMGISLLPGLVVPGPCGISWWRRVFSGLVGMENTSLKRMVSRTPKKSPLQVVLSSSGVARGTSI